MAATITGTDSFRQPLRPLLETTSGRPATTGFPFLLMTNWLSHELISQLPFCDEKFSTNRIAENGWRAERLFWSFLKQNCSDRRLRVGVEPLISEAEVKFTSVIVPWIWQNQNPVPGTCSGNLFPVLLPPSRSSRSEPFRRKSSKTSVRASPIFLTQCKYRWARAGGSL